MSIRIFYIPFNYKNSTENLFQLAIKDIPDNDYSKILYIAPSQKKIRESQRIFHRLTRGCYIHPETLTIKQFSKRLYSLYGDKKFISQSLIPIVISELSNRGIGYSSIITNFINEIKQYHTGKDIETVENELRSIFHKLGIPEIVSVRAGEAMGIYKAYQEILNKHSTVDENDVMATCPELIKKHCFDHTLILDGFYELTKSEEKIIKALIENSKNTLTSIPHDANHSDITENYIQFITGNFTAEAIHFSSPEEKAETLYYSFPGIEEEIEGISRTIKNNFISGKMKDLENIVVTFPNLKKYIDIVSRVFRKYGIPYTAFRSKTLGKVRPFLDLLALLESVIDDYPRLAFSQFLTSPYFKNIPLVLRDSIPYICMRSGISKGKDAWLNFFKSEARSQKSETEEKEIKRVFRKLAPLEAIRDGASYSQYSETIVKLLNDLDFTDINTPGIAEIDSSRESYQQNIDLKQQVLELLKELPFIDGITSSLPHSVSQTLRQFTDAFSHMLNTTYLELEGKGVQIIDFFEMKGLEPEYLYFGGLRDGDLPSKPDIDHILPDNVRTTFGLVNLNRYLLLQRFVFQRTIESAKNRFLSYPLMENDRFFLPSPFLPWNKESRYKTYGIFSREEELLRKGKITLSSLIKEIEGIEDKSIKKKFGVDSYIRVTDIDSYRACPRRFFIEKVLQLEPMEIKEYEVEAIVLGTLSHEIMQALISEELASLDDFRVKAESIIDRILADKPLDDYWKSLIRDTFISILPDIYKLENKLNEEGYSFFRAELPVRGELIEGIKLKGKIDRIDKKFKSSRFKVQGSKENKTDVVELIDYKTGSVKFIGSQILKKGSALQLFLYTALVKTIGLKAERAGIYSLKDLSLSWIPGKNDKKEGRTIEDYVKTALVFLEETISNMRSRNFSASPLDEQTCWSCPERPYCPYILKTTKSLKK